MTEICSGVYRRWSTVCPWLISLDSGVCNEDRIFRGAGSPVPRVFRRRCGIPPNRFDFRRCQSA